MTVRPRPSDDNPLWDYFLRNEGRIIDKWHHYFDIYDNHFRRFRGKPVTLLEIGVYRGGSLQMWKSYFGSEASIFGVDIDPRCKGFEEDQIRIFVGDQADQGFLRRLRDEIGTIDIVIDDGGHTMAQQIVSLEGLYPAVSETGVYLVEDTHTSYWEEYGGGYRQSGSFIEYAKELVDQLNAWHSRDARLSPGRVTNSASGLHFYDGVLVIEKYPRNEKPRSSMSGDTAQLIEEYRARIAEKDRAIQALTAQLAEKERALTAITGSRSWRLILLLRKARVRAKRYAER